MRQRLSSAGGKPAGSPILSTKRTTASGLLFRLRDEGGSFAVESAMGFMLMMTMVIGIIECCMMSYTWAVLEQAAREGVRYASVHGTDNSTSCSGPSTGCDAAAANVVSAVKNYAATFVTNPSTMVVTVTYPDGVSTGTSRVKVSITETYKPVLHYPGVAPTLTISSTGRILY